MMYKRDNIITSHDLFILRILAFWFNLIFIRYFKDNYYLSLFQIWRINQKEPLDLEINKSQKNQDKKDENRLKSKRKNKLWDQPLSYSFQEIPQNIQSKGFGQKKENLLKYEIRKENSLEKIKSGYYYD